LTDSAQEAAEQAGKRLEDVVWAFSLVRRRYPLLVRTSEEMDLLRRHFTKNFYNDGVMQVLRDSFDMLVVDLFSIREAIVETDGVIAHLRKLPGFLRPVSAGERWQAPIPSKEQAQSAGSRDPERDAFFETHFRKGLNDAIDRLIPSYATSQDPIKHLISRFRADTDALNDDRNRVRAHRYEKTSRETSQLFIPLPDLAAQIETMERYLSDLYRVSTGNSFQMSIGYSYSANEASRDLADLIVLGSINRATLDFGLVTEPSGRKGEQTWYWKSRQDFLQIPPGGDSQGKRLVALTEADLKTSPVWKYHNDLDGEATWVQPCRGLSRLSQGSEEDYLAATRFTFSDGSAVAGFCSPVETSKLESLRPAVFGRLGQVRIWTQGRETCRSSDVENRLQKPHDQLFPISFVCDIPVDVLRVSGTIELSIEPGMPPNPTLKLTVTSLPTVAP
jgi:hypothetical protein